jgi:hypothetical protein
MDSLLRAGVLPGLRTGSSACSPGAGLTEIHLPDSEARFVRRRGMARGRARGTPPVKRRWGPLIAAVLSLVGGAPTVRAQDSVVAQPTRGIPRWGMDGETGRASSGLRFAIVRRSPPGLPARGGARGCRTLWQPERVTVPPHTVIPVAIGLRHDLGTVSFGAARAVADSSGVQHTAGPSFPGPRALPSADLPPRYATRAATQTYVHRTAWADRNERSPVPIIGQRVLRIPVAGDTRLPRLFRSLLVWRTTLDVARVAARLVTASARAGPGEPDLRIGVAADLQAHGSPASWHPHLDLVVR